MKTLPKKLATWFFSLFNIGMYSQSDALDSLVPKLNLVGLNKHADTIEALSKTIEHQQDIIIMLDGVRCVIMLISLAVLIATNQDAIKATYQCLKKFFVRLLSLLRKATKTRLRGVKKTFKPKKNESRH